jgi:hypothetical protein
MRFKKCKEFIQIIYLSDKLARKATKAIPGPRKNRVMEMRLLPPSIQLGHEPGKDVLSILRC